MEEPREENFYMEEWTEVKDGKKSVPLNHVEYESALRMYIKHLQSQLKNHGVSHHVISTFKCPHGLDCKEPCVMHGKGNHSMCY